MTNRSSKVTKGLFNPFAGLYRFIVNKIGKSIRFEIMVVFAICLFVSIIAGGITTRILQMQGDNLKIGRSSVGIASNKLAIDLANNIEGKNISIDDKLQIDKIVKAENYNPDYKIIICNPEGKTIYKTANVSEPQVDINSVIKNYFDSQQEEQPPFKSGEQTRDFSNFYPVTFSNGDGYIIINGTLNEMAYYDAYSSDDAAARYVLPAAVLVTFILMFFLLTNKKMRYFQFVLDGLLEMSKGNLGHRIKRQGNDELALLADKINYMANELNVQIENERKADRVKRELITNVSHDLRTPLTSIKGYLDLIKNKKYSEERQLDQYVNIAYSKSEKLENLVNDLFEYTKLTNNAVTIERQNIILNELLGQLIEEFVPASEDNNVTLKKDFIKEKVIANVDPDKTVRIFENLLVNAVRYCIKPSDIVVSLRKDDTYSEVRIKNKCEPIDKKDLERIFDRFYRIEKSRSSDTGGSGLGLAIAKNMVEIQGGTIEAQYEDNYISFIVRFKL